MKGSIYGGEEANELRLLMTTYRQHIMTSFGCVRDKSTVFTHFLGQFSKIYTSVLVNMLKINFTTISFKNTKFSAKWNLMGS